jgi:hypothetical protein
MEDNTLVQSSLSATINAPIEKVDIPSWCFTLPESEYQSCSPAHCSAGATTAPDGRGMSINVEILGGSLIVQHYITDSIISVLSAAVCTVDACIRKPLPVIQVNIVPKFTEEDLHDIFEPRNDHWSYGILGAGPCCNVLGADAPASCRKDCQDLWP